MTDGIPTDLLVASQVRCAAREGVSIYVMRRGDNTSGSIVLKINLLNGTARVLTQVRLDNELVWSPLGKTDPMPEQQADQSFNQQADFDPDIWLVEIEDKKGRLWFPGRVLDAFPPR